ncbi:MAG: alpha/beta fold hydrolase [Bacteroidia bacterium]
MHPARKNINLKVNNLDVSYNDEGPANRQTVIFIHGFPFNKSIWDFQLEHLKENYRVIAYDVRGHGKSQAGTEKFSIEMFATDLISFMDELEIDTAIICGLSMGGYIALTAVEKYPDRFTGLILCDTQSKADTNEMKENRMKAIESIKLNGTEDYADESVKKLFAYISFTSKREEIAVVRDMIINTPVEILAKTLIALAERNETTNKLGEINMPVLIMVGKKDILTPPEKSELMHEKIQNSTLELIDYAGHLPNLENPYEFNRSLKKFLDKITDSDKQPHFERNTYNPPQNNAIELLASKVILNFYKIMWSFKKLAS